MSTFSSEKGFTLLEMMLSVALLAIVMGTSYTLYTNIAQQGQLEATVASAEALVRKAILLSSAVEGDSSWGVQFDRPQTVLFKGSSFEERDPSYDEILEIPEFPLSGELEYVFQRVSGKPVEPGVVTFTNEYTGDERSLTINAMGTFE